MSMTNPEERLTFYRKAQKILIEDEAPVIPLFADVNQVLVSQRIENFRGNPIDLYLFQNMRLKK